MWMVPLYVNRNMMMMMILGEFYFLFPHFIKIVSVFTLGTIIFKLQSFVGVKIVRYMLKNLVLW